MGELDKIREQLTERTLEDVLEGALHSGEKVVWAREPERRPSLGPVFGAAALFLALAALDVALLSIGSRTLFRWGSGPFRLEDLALPLGIAVLSVIVVVVGAVALKKTLAWVMGAPDLLYVVTQRRALVVRPRLGPLAVELGEGTRWFLRKGLFEPRPSDILVRSATGESLLFERLLDATEALVEIQDARGNVRNAADQAARLAPGELEEVVPEHEGPSAVEKFAERKRRAREG